MNKIVFSIIIPSYNRANFIRKAIDSVFNQSFLFFEVILIDDGSTDNTEDIAKQINDSRFIYCRTENRERGAARNKGIELARGEYITFLDSDDYLLENHLEVAYKTITNSKNIPWFHLKYKIEHKNHFTIPNYPKYKDTITTKLFTGNFLSCHGVFVKSSLLQEFKFNENRQLSGLEDWELWIRISTKYDLQIIDSVTNVLVNHSNRSVISANSKLIIDKTLFFQNTVLNNSLITQKFNLLLKKFKSSTYSYISLHLALTKKDKKAAFSYLLKAVRYNPGIIFKKRFYVIIKLLISPQWD